MLNIKNDEKLLKMLPIIDGRKEQFKFLKGRKSWREIIYQLAQNDERAQTSTK